nr:KilA-N domain-containing protein [uncultured Moraxella sp.]
MQQLMISNQVISQDKNGFFSLNDLHKASGSENKHKPSYFMSNQQTRELIQAIESENQIAYHTVKGGDSKTTKQGTFVCREIVIAYAMWISAKFSLEVIRAFDNLNTGAIPCLPKKTNAHQRQALVTACDKLAVGNTLRSDIYKMVGNQFGVDDIQSIPMHQLADATAFVYEILLAKSAQPNHNAHSEHNAKWRMVGLLEYHRHDKEIRQLQTAFANIKNQTHQAMNQLENYLDHIANNKGLIYDALDQQRIPTTDPKQRMVEAKTLIERIHAYH